jgi:hypothetical protein
MYYSGETARERMQEAAKASVGSCESVRRMKATRRQNRVSPRTPENYETCEIGLIRRSCYKNTYSLRASTDYRARRWWGKRTERRHTDDLVRLAFSHLDHRLSDSTPLRRFELDSYLHNVHISVIDLITESGSVPVNTDQALSQLVFARKGTSCYSSSAASSGTPKRISAMNPSFSPTNTEPGGPFGKSIMAITDVMHSSGITVSSSLVRA